MELHIHHRGRMATSRPSVAEFDNGWLDKQQGPDETITFQMYTWWTSLQRCCTAWTTTNSDDNNRVSIVLNVPFTWLNFLSTFPHFTFHSYWVTWLIKFPKILLLCIYQRFTLHILVKYFPSISNLKLFNSSEYVRMNFLSCAIYISFNSKPKILNVRHQKNKTLYSIHLYRLYYIMIITREHHDRPGDVGRTVPSPLRQRWTCVNLNMREFYENEYCAIFFNKLLTNCRTFYESQHATYRGVQYEITRFTFDFHKYVSDHLTW